MGACDGPCCGGRPAFLAEQRKQLEEKRQRFVEYLREREGAACERSTFDEAWCQPHQSVFELNERYCVYVFAITDTAPVRVLDISMPV